MTGRLFFAGSLLLLLTAAPLLNAAEDLASSPWVGWRQGYNCYDRAAAAREAHEYDKALELYTQSRDYYLAVQKHFPDWNKQVIAGRIRLCEEEIANVRKLMGRPASGRRAPRTPAPEEGTSAPRTTSRPRSSGRSAAAPEGGASGRLYIELQSEVEQYRQRLRLALQEIDDLQVKLRQAETRARDVDGILRDYRLLQDKYTLLEVRYKDAQARAAAPGRELERLQNQLLEEKMKLDESSAEQRRLTGEIGKRDQEISRIRQEVAQLQENAKQHANEIRRMEREIELARAAGGGSGSAADESAWRKRLESLEAELAHKEQRLARVMNLLAENSGDKVASSLAQEVKTMQEELNQLGNAARSEESLRRRVADLTAQLQTVREQLLRSEETRRTLKTDLQNARNEAQNARKQSDVANADLRLMQERAAKLETELANWEKRFGDLEKRYQDRIGSDALRNSELNKANTALTASLTAARAEAQQLREQLGSAQNAVQTSEKQIGDARKNIMELKNKLLSCEIELRKMADLQKAYDELKNRFDLIQKASNADDVLATLNRIPGLEESIRRYEQENAGLLSELNKLKKALSAKTDSPAKPALPAAETEKLEALLAEARTAEARNNQEVAIWGYRQVLARDPDNAEGARRLGAVYLARGQFDDAVPLLQQAVRSIPGDGKVLNDLARALIGKRDYATALALLQARRQERQGRAEGDLLLTEALAWSRSGKAAEAENAFRGVLKLDPGNAEAAYELALMLSADPKRRKEAGEFYLLAKERGVAPDSYLEEVLKEVTGSDQETLTFLRGNALEALEKRDWVSTDWYLAELEKLAPGDRAARRLRQAEHILRDRVAEAVKLGEQAALDADDGDRVLLAAALLEAGRVRDAEEVLKRLGPDARCKDAPEVLKKHLAKYKQLEARFR